ncbi:MAG TPA: MerR family DNA-binding transcriptional regulator [Ktedonobacterales bacterium]|nr:MerR family DNA-binding transcriptional regulator [Ktedonobacterales bacterium]
MTMTAGRSLRALASRWPGDARAHAHDLARDGEREKPADERDSSGGAETLTIGQVARLTGVSAKTIRYYESVGLLPRPPRSANSYRRYGGADVSRILLLHRLRGLGASGAAAQPLLAQLDDARCADVRQDLLSLLDERLRALDDEIATLRRLRAEASDYRRAVAACQPDPDVLYRECVTQTAPPLRGVGMLPCATPFDDVCSDGAVAGRADSSGTATDDMNDEERIHAIRCCDDECCACCA